MNRFRKFKVELRLKEAVRQADEAHSLNGERYYVVANTKGKLLIVDRKNFRGLKQKGYISRIAKVADLERECFYCTPYRNGSSKLSDEVVANKAIQYLSWVESGK